MATAKKTNDTKEIEILRISQNEVEFCILGLTPVILNRMSEKARRELLLPRKKTKSERESTLKHNPYLEFRASAYRSADPKCPTLLLAPCNAFKASMRNAALDIPGSASKAQIGRLAYVVGDYQPIFGIPKLFMSIVRSADINRTPDVRTRVIVPEWAARIRVRYVTPNLREQVVANLVAGAGITQGLGDWRTEKGKGDYGQFQLVDQNDPEFLRICAEQGREPQVEALRTPQCYDTESAELLTWFDEETKARGFGDVSDRDEREYAA